MILLLSPHRQNNVKGGKLITGERMILNKLFRWWIGEYEYQKYITFVAKEKKKKKEKSITLEIFGLQTGLTKWTEFITT